ncbi:sensor histidine kinase, partial [Campylobacter jejuni]|nr:sensor histidine kinase [Campylobacter jejuni]
TATSSANEWRLVVYNTGQTLAQADKERIYERFYRADKARSAEGSGLGLAIVKEAVEALSGQIVVTSPYKNGTKFTVTLPLFLA